MPVWTSYVTVRPLRLQKHRENTLRQPFALFVNRFGAAVVPKDLWVLASSARPRA